MTRFYAFALVAALCLCSLTFPGIAQSLKFERCNIPYGGRLSTVFPITNDRIIGSTPTQHYITSDQGAHWERLSDLSGQFISVTMLRDTRTIAITESGSKHKVFVSLDSGRTWAPNVHQLNNAQTILELLNGDILAMRRDSLYLSTDGLHSTINISHTIPTKFIYLNSIHQASNGSIYLVNGTTLLKSGNNAKTWDSVAAFSSSIDDIESIGNLLYIATSNKIMTSTNGGETWNTVYTFGGNPIHARFHKNSKFIYVFRNTNEFYYSSVSSIDWKHVSTDSLDYSQSGMYYPRYFCVTESNLYLNGIWVSSDNGGSWEVRNNGVTSHNLHPFLIDQDTIYAHSQYGEIAHGNHIERNLFFMSTDNGKSWNAQNQITAALRIISDQTQYGHSATSSDTHLYLDCSDALFIVNKATGMITKRSYGVPPIDRSKIIVYDRRTNSAIYSHPDVMLPSIWSSFGTDTTFREVKLPDTTKRYELLQSSDGRPFVKMYDWNINSGFAIYEYDEIHNRFIHFCDIDTLHAASTSIVIDSRNNIYSARYQGIPYGQIEWLDISRDKGATWSVFEPDSKTIRSVVVDSSGIVYVFSPPGILFLSPGIYYSSNSGVTWEKSAYTSEWIGMDKVKTGSNGRIYFNVNGEIWYNTDVPQYTVSTPSLHSTPTDLTLLQCYPNPVNGVNMGISFQLPQRMNVSVILYNSLGSKVGEVYNGLAGPGVTTVPYNTSSLQSGMYRYVLQTPTGMQSKWMVVSR